MRELLICCVLFTPLSIIAQTTGSIVGTVSDAAGAVVPGAKVSVVSETTHVARQLTTDERGEYNATLLPVDIYSVIVEHPGLEKSETKQIKVDVNQVVRMDVLLRVGSVSTVAQVKANAELVKTDQADVSQVIDATQITQMPLNGRNFLELALLSPGTTEMARADSNIGNNGAGVIANGASSNSGAYSVDGVPMQDKIDNRATLHPNVDAIAEFKIMTADYSAEYGRGSGANVLVITKSGTNALHGSAYEFLRNSVLDARNFFDGPTIAPFKQNQFGGTLGGPIRRNKTFFFVSYEGIRSSTGLTVNSIVPTDAQRTGNMAGGPAIYDPLTTRTVPATGKIARDIFPGNQIPSNRIAPQSTAILKLLYPAAQQQAPFKINYHASPQQIMTNNPVIARVDQNFTATDVVYARYAGGTIHNISPGQGSSPFPGSGGISDIQEENAVVGYTKVFSANIVNEARIGFNREAHNLAPTLDTSCIVCSLGIGGVSTLQRDWGPPNISISNIAPVGAFPSAPQTPTTNQFVWNDTLSVVKGRHSLRLGTDIERGQMNGWVSVMSRGSFSFTGQETNNPQSPLNTGQGIADFLLGYPASASTQVGDNVFATRDIEAGFFVQDDWHVLKNLTLNLGLRYENAPPPVDAKNELALWDGKLNAIVLSRNNLNAPTVASGYEGQPLSSLIAAFPMFNFMTASQAGLPPSLATGGRLDFAPRLGFAWRIFGNNNTVFRGGWGRFYEVVGLNIDLKDTANPPYARTLSFTSAPNALPQLTLANSFPNRTVKSTPAASNGRYLDWRNPYDDNFNATIEQRVSPNSTFTVGYVGARGVGQYMPIDFNSPVPGLGNSQQNRPNPKVGAIGYQAVPWGYRWYNSLQSSFQARLSNLTLLVSYTRSKLITEGGGGINEFNHGVRFGWNFFGTRPMPTGQLGPDNPFLTIDRGLAPFDQRNRFVLSLIYRVPIGKGKLLDVPGPVDWIMGNWELSDITTIESGDALTPVLSVDNLNGAGGQANGAMSRPNVVGDPNNGPKTIANWFDKSVFSAPVALATVLAQGLNPVFAAGNSGRGIIRGPSLINFDIGIFRNFPVWERLNFQFRAEMFNAFNHANFNDPNVTFGSATFGQITSADTARQIQFALKVTF